MADNNLLKYAAALGLKGASKTEINLYGYLADIFVTLRQTDPKTYRLTLRLGGAADAQALAERARQAKALLSAADGDAAASIVHQDGLLLATIPLKKGKTGCARLRAIAENCIPALRQAGFGRHVCEQCGGEILPGDEAFLYKDNGIKTLHAGCCDETLRQADLLAREESDAAHAGRGALGAFLGAAAGAVLYFLIGLLGYVAAFVGLVTGFLTNFLYAKLGGKPGRKKLIVLLAALLFSVALGQGLYYTYQFASLYGESGFAEEGVSRAEYTAQMWKCWIFGEPEDFLSWNYDVLLDDLTEAEQRFAMTREAFIRENYTPDYDQSYAEVKQEFTSNLLQGLLFTALGGLPYVIRSSKSEHKTLRRLPA